VLFIGVARVRVRVIANVWVSFVSRVRCPDQIDSL
jgi:hypothetical protein